MNRRFAVAAALAIGLAGCGREADLDADAAGLAAAEERFAASASESGIRDAFLGVLAPDGIIFRPKPVDGTEWFEAREPDPGVLDWRPAFVEIARSGDLGYTTGPWEYRAAPDDTSSPSRGYYLSFWRKDVDGEWRLVADVGVVDATAPPVASVNEPRFALPDAPAKPIGDEGVKARRAEIFAAERDLAVRGGEVGFGPAFLERCDAAVRFYRFAEPITVGIEPLRERIADETSRIMNDPLSALVSGAGDLGYTYGTMEVLHAQGEGVVVEAFGVLRGWRRSGAGEWTIVAEVEVPLGG